MNKITGDVIGFIMSGVHNIELYFNNNNTTTTNTIVFFVKIYLGSDQSLLKSICRL